MSHSTCGFYIFLIYLCVCVCGGWGCVGICVCIIHIINLKNVIVFFFGRFEFQRGAHLKKKYKRPTFHFFFHQEKTKILQHISYRYKQAFFSQYRLCCLPNLQRTKNKAKYANYHAWFLFAPTPGVDSFSRYFGTVH